jgi:thymidylate kinase
MNHPVNDKNFDMVSTLYHASQGVQLSQQFSQDATEKSDQEAQAFFDRVTQHYEDIADEARKLLKQTL